MKYILIFALTIGAAAQTLSPEELNRRASIAIQRRAEAKAAQDAAALAALEKRGLALPEIAIKPPIAGYVVVQITSGWSVVSIQRAALPLGLDASGSCAFTSDPNDPAYNGCAAVKKLAEQLDGAAFRNSHIYIVTLAKGVLAVTKTVTLPDGVIVWDATPR